MSFDIGRDNGTTVFSIKLICLGTYRPTVNHRHNFCFVWRGVLAEQDIMKAFKKKAVTIKLDWGKGTVKIWVKLNMYENFSHAYFKLINLCVLFCAMRIGFNNISIKNEL